MKLSKDAITAILINCGFMFLNLGMCLFVQSKFHLLSVAATAFSAFCANRIYVNERNKFFKNESAAITK